MLAAFLACSSDAAIVPAECQGQCNLGTTVRILPDEIWYCRVKPTDVSAIAQSHLENNQPVDRLLHPRIHPTYACRPAADCSTLCDRTSSINCLQLDDSGKG